MSTQKKLLHMVCLIIQKDQRNPISRCSEGQVTSKPECAHDKRWKEIYIFRDDLMLPAINMVLGQLST